jgi:hypothetical protein
MGSDYARTPLVTVSQSTKTRETAAGCQKFDIFHKIHPKALFSGVKSGTYRTRRTEMVLPHM